MKIKNLPLLLTLISVSPCLTAFGAPDKAGAYPLWSGDPIPNDPNEISSPKGIEHRTIHDARESDYKFLHGAAIIHFKDRFYANWANSPVHENYPNETLQGKHSKDPLGEWSEIEMIAPGFKDEERHSHAAYLEHEGQLWTFPARFGKGAKGTRFTGLGAEAWLLDEKSGKWQNKGRVIDNCWPYDEPVLMDNGSYITGGQDKDGLPVVAISRGGNLLKWDSVLIPHPKELKPQCAETTVWAEGKEVVAVIRGGGGVAWVSISKDYGKTWSEARPSNMPMPRSKAYLGKLSTGQLYMVSNLSDRNTLVVSVGKPGEKTLSKMWRIRHGSSKPVPRFKGYAKSPQWSYPYAHEHDGKLYIVYSIGKEDCGLSVIPIESLKGNDEPARNPETLLWDPGKTFPASGELLPLKQVRFNVIKKNEPDVDGYNWLHGAALIWHKGELFTFFGNNAGHENTPTEVARESRSRDGGKTWGPVRMLAGHIPGRGRSHGAFLSHANELWALVGQIGNDAQGRKRAIVETLAYKLNGKTGEWEEMGLAARDFWPVDEPTKMADGNWIMGGMSDCVDGKAMPSVAISKGSDFSQWDVVRIPLPKGTKLWGETSVIVENDHVLALVRNKGEVLASVSKDRGRTWSVCTPSGIRSSSTKVFAGKLSTGQRYAIGTLASDHGKNQRISLNRSILSIAVSRPGENRFHSVFKIRSNSEATGPGEPAANGALSYPYAVEHEGFLYVAYSNDGGRGGNKNSAELAIIPIKSLTTPNS